MEDLNAENEVRECLAQLRLTINESLPLDLAKVFPKRSGMGWKGDVKTRVKYLNNCEGKLSQLLNEGEEIVYISKGVQQKFAEQYFLGIWAQFINQTVFVFTNLRVILFNSDTKGNPKHTLWSIYYCEIEKFKSNFLGSSVTMRLRDGGKFVYSGFKGIDRKEIPKVVEAARAAYNEMGFTPQSTQSRENLCCDCVQVVPKDQYTCGACGKEFYKPMELAKRSFIFPSWGDFSMGHTLLACMELFGYLLSWLIFAGIFVGAQKDGDTTVAIMIIVAFLAFEHIVDGTLTYYIAKKGLTPKPVAKS